MAEAWLWVVIGIVLLMSFIWVADYWYNYHVNGICTDERGNSYACGKAYRYASDYNTNYNTISYSYYDNYGNSVSIDRTHNFDDYYDCYHANTPGDRYGKMLREQYGLVCRGYDAVNDNYNYNNVQYVSNYNSYSEKAPLIYVN